MKLVWRTIPIDLYDWSAIEGWLEHMAQKGYQPKKTFGHRVGLEKAEFSHTRCRLVPSPHVDEEPETEFVEDCAAAGWEYVDQMRGIYHLFMTHDPDAPEMFTDPVTGDMIFTRLDKRSRNGWISIGIIALLALAIFLYSSFKNALTGWNFLLSNVWLLFLMLCIHLLLYPSVRRRKRKHRARLRAGIPVEHGMGWEKARKAYWADLTVRVVTWIILFAFAMWPYRPGARRDLTEAPVLLSLKQVDASEEAENGYFKKNASLLAPTQIKTYQYLDDSWMAATYYELTFSSLAVPFARDLMTHYDEEVFPALYEAAELSAGHGFDYLAAARRADEGGWLMVAALENKVAYIRYSGPANLLDNLEDLRDVLD